MGSRRRSGSNGSLRGGNPTAKLHVRFLMTSLLGRDAPSELFDEFSLNGVSRHEALALFDSLPGTALEDMLGDWRGLPLHMGHPLDGLLEAHGWRGKAFRTADDVAPLLSISEREQ